MTKLEKILCGLIPTVLAIATPRGSFTFAQENSREFDLAQLEELLAKNPATDLETVLKLLPSSLFQEAVMVVNSQSLQTGTVRFPRVVLNSPSGEFLFAYGGEKRTNETVDIIQYSKQKHEFGFFRVEFDGTTPAKIQKGENCAACHGSGAAAAPIWREMHVWSGIWAGASDKMDSYNEYGSYFGTLDGTRRLIQEEKDNPRYQRIGALQTFTGDYHSNPGFNRRFTKKLSLLNLERATSLIQALPQYSDPTFKIKLAEGLFCHQKNWDEQTQLLESLGVPVRDLGIRTRAVPTSNDPDFFHYQGAIEVGNYLLGALIQGDPLFGNYFSAFQIEAYGRSYRYAETARDSSGIALTVPEVCSRLKAAITEPQPPATARVPEEGPSVLRTFDSVDFQEETLAYDVPCDDGKQSCEDLQNKLCYDVFYKNWAPAIGTWRKSHPEAGLHSLHAWAGSATYSATHPQPSGTQKYACFLHIEWDPRYTPETLKPVQ